LEEFHAWLIDNNMEVPGAYFDGELRCLYYAVFDAACGALKRQPTYANLLAANGDDRG
jgi:hypothetical protein